MEPEELPWPGELEEEEEEEEEEETEEAEERANLDSDEVVMVEEVEEEERRELDSDFNYESQPRERTDEEDDEEAKAWLQAHPEGALPPSSLSRHRYSEDERTGLEKIVPLTCHVWQQPLYQGNSGTQISDTAVVSVEKTARWRSKADQGTESWHYLPQEMDSSHTLDITQTRFNMREEGTEVTDFTSVEEGILTQPENQVKEAKRGLLCSPLLVIQDNFASPDLPLLTCLTQDQEFGSDSLFQQSELDFAPLRGIPGKSEDTEWFSRPSEVSEALFQAASEVASDLVNSCISVSPHLLIASTAECQRSFLPFEQGTKEDTISSDTVDELKTPKDFDSYDALCSYMAWKTQEVQEPETSLADKGQVSVSTSSYTSDDYVTPEGSDSFDASCSHVQYWKQKALQQSENYLTNGYHDSYSDSSDIIEKNKIPKGSDNFRAPFSRTPWSKQEASHHPETYVISKDCVCFPHEVAPHFNNKMSHSLLHCLLERRGKGIPLTAHSHYFESVYLRAPAENGVKGMMDSLEGYERNEEGLGKELSQGFELKENRSTLVFSEMHPRSSDTQFIENVVVPDNSVKVSEIHIHSRQYGTSKMEVSGGPLQTIKSNLSETSEQLYLQEERNQRATSAFGGKSVDASENVAFEVVIASIEPSKKESTGNEIQTDSSKSLTNDSQESEPKNSHLSLLNYNDENSFFDEFSHPRYQSTPGVFELVASKPLLHKKGNDESSLDWHLDLKSLPSTPQEMVIKPLPLIPEHKSPAALSEKSHSQAVRLGKAQSALFQCDLDSEPFLPIGKVKSVPDLDLAEKVGSSNIFYPMKVSTSDSMVLQDLRRFEEVADSSNYILVKNVNSSNIIEGPSATVGSSFSANLVTCDAKSQGALPMTSNASLIAVSQESMLKADVGQGKIPRPMGAKSCFTINTIMQNDSYFVEGLQGKAESDTSTLDDDTECCNLDENAIGCSTRVADLQREVHEQGDLTAECIALAGFKNVLDDLEVCDSSLPWQSALELPSKEESDFEEPVGCSNMDINQTFSSVLPPFIPHEPTIELEYHSSDLRMLRVSPDTVQKTLKHIAGGTSKGGVAEVTQSSLKPGITATPGDSDTRSHLFLFPEDFPQLDLRSPQENTVGQHTDTHNQEASVDSDISEETLKVSSVGERADQKTGISTVPSSFYSQRGKPSIFYPQALPDSHLAEEALKVSAVLGPTVQKSGIPTVFPSSYFRGENHNIFYQQALPDSHLTEEALKVLAIPGPADQKTSIPIVLPSSYSHGEKRNTFYQQALPGSHLTEETLKYSAVPGSADQKTSIPTVLPSSYSHGETHVTFHPQALPHSHLTEEALKVSGVPHPTDQKTSIHTVPPSSYSCGEKHNIFYPQALPDSHLTEEALKVSAVPGPADQKTSIPTVLPSSYSRGEKHNIFYPQALPDSHLTEETLKISAVPGPADQKTSIPTVLPSSYSRGEKHNIFYPQALPDSHLTEETLKISAVPGPADQKTSIPTVLPSSYSRGEKHNIFYPQALPDSHLTEETLKISAVPVSTDQRTEKTIVPSTSYSRREKHIIFSQQQLSDGHLTKQVLKVSFVPGPADQNTGIPTLSSHSYSLGEKPGIFYQQVLPDSHLIEQTQKVAALPGPADQKSRIPAVSSTSYSHRERPHIFYQQTLPESHLTEQALKFSAPESTEQKTGIPTVTSTSSSHREKSSIFYEEELLDSHLTEQAQKVPAVPGPADQDTGIPIVPSRPYSRGEKPSIFCQQVSPDSHLSEETLISVASGPAEKKSGLLSEASNFCSRREKHNIFYQEELQDSSLTEQAQKVSPVPEPTDQKTKISTVTSTSYSDTEKPFIFYPQGLPDRHLPEDALKVTAVSEPADQKTGIPVVPSTSSSHREKPIIFYPQDLTDTHVTEEALKASAISGSADWKTGISTVSSTSYSPREKPIIFSPQALPGSHLLEEVLKVSADQKTGLLSEPSSSYSHREKPITFYPEGLTDGQLPQEALKIPAVSGPTDQKTELPPEPSSSYSPREKPIIFPPQALPGNHLLEEALKISAIPGSADQKTGLPSEPSSSYSHREKPIIFNPEDLTDGQVPQEALKVSTVSGLTDQKTELPPEPSSSYSPREKPIIFPPQALPGNHLLEEALKISAIPGSADQKTGLPSEPSSSYSYREKPVIFYPEGLTDGQVPQESLKVSVIPGPTDQKIGLPSEPSSSYSYREKPIVFYPEGLTDSQVPQEALKVSAIPGPTDQKTGLPSEPSSSYSYREKPITFYPQGLTDSQISQEALKVSAIPGPADQKTGLPSEPSSSYSHREKPIIFYPQGLTDGQVPQEALKVSAVPGPADQKTGLPSELSSSHSYREKPIIFYSQGLTDSRVPQEALKVSAIPGPADQKTGLPSEPSSSYSYREKPLIFYPQGLTDSQVPQEALKVSALPGPAAQKTGLPLEPSSSYSYREKPIIFYSQGLTDSRVPQEALKVSAIPGPADQKTGLPSEPSSYSPREKPIIFYPQGLTDDHVPQEALKVSAIPGPIDQKIGLPSEPSSSYSHREKSNIFYQQELSGSHLTEETLKVSAVSTTGDQKTGIPSSSYSLGGKPIIFCQQALSDKHLTEESLNVSASPEPADQETGIPTVPSVSYSHRERPSILYQQPLSDNQLPIEALKISAVSGPGDQKTRKPTITSASYSHREKPIIYQQELPDLTQAALSVFRVPGLGDQKTGIPVVTSTPYSHREKPIISYQQELPEHNEGALKVLGAPGSADQKTGIQFGSSASYSHRESPIFSYQRELPDITEETLKVSAVSGPADQKTGIHIIPSSSYSYREKDSIFYQQELPDVTEGALKIFALPGPADQKTEIPTGSSSSYSHKEKLKTSPVILPDDQKTELLTTPLSSYSQREKPKISTVIGPDNQTTSLLTVLHNSYSQRVKPFQQELPDRHHSEDILKISPVSEPTDVNSGIPIPLSSSYSHREKSNIFYPQELPDKHLAEDALKVSTIPIPADQKSLLPTVPPSSFSHREKPNIFYQQNFPDRHKTQDALMFSRGVGQVDQITGLSTVTPGTYSHREKQKLVSDHVQMLIDNLDSSNSSVISNSVPLSSQADGRVVISKPESSGFEDVGSEENQDTSSGSKTLKEIRTLLMEAENIALKRCNFPAPLVPFRDVSDISFIQSKKVVCFKEPLTADESNGDLPQRQPFTEESPSDRCIQKDISTQTNLKCQRGIENWEFISSTTVRSPLQEAESKARVTVDETLRQYRADKSVMRPEPEGYSGTIGNKIVIPMMTIIKSDSSSDASSCSWDSNSLESVSDVLLNFIPYASPKTSLTDSREEEGVLESDDAGGSSVDSLATHVRNLLKCESSLNHAKQILRNAEEEECRVRARAWNLKFNLAHECGYSISELNEDDRRKVEEIKAKLFGHERTGDLSKGLRSPRGIGYKPEAVCSHIIIESHEKGCFRTLTAEQPQLDSHPCVFRSADPSEMIRGQRSPSSWRTRHIDLSKSLDQSNPHFKVWNSLQLRSHSPFQNFTTDDFRISQGLRMPFHEKIDPWLSELVEPACVPPEEMDCHSSSQMLPPESMKKFTTSITFSSHRHSKCFSDSSVLKVGVTEGSQCTGASVGVFNSHFTEEQNPPRDLEQRTSSPSSFKIVSHSPDKAVTILAESSRQSQKLSVEHSQQEEKLLERSDFKGSDSEPSTSAKCSNVKEVHFSDNHTFISMSRPSSTLGVKEKNVTITPDLASHIILEQRELFEPSKASHADHHVRKYHSPPPQHQDYVAPNLPCHIFLEKRELFEQSKAPHLDHQMRENHSPFPQGQDYIASDLPSSIFLEQRQLFEQSKAPDVDHMGKYHSPLPPGQDYVVEKNNQHKFKSYISNMINVEAKFDNVVSHSAPNQCTLVTSASTPPSNRKALSCVHITLYPKTPSKVDSGTLDKRFHSLDPASKTRMNSEFNSDLQTLSSRSLEPTSKLLTGKPVAQNQESLGFLGPKSSPDFQVVQSPLPDSNTISQDLKNILFQNSQIVTSRQTQVNISDLEGYSSPEGTPVSADRPSEVIKTPFSAFPGKSSSDAVTQITTESPGKTMFSSEIFINDDDRGLEIPEPSAQKLGKVPTTFASSSSVQQITHPHGTDAQPSLLPYKPPGSTKMYYVPQLKQIPSSLDSRSDTTIESSHSGSNDAIAPDFPAEVLGTRDDDLPVTDNIKHKEGIYSKRVVAKPTLPMGGKPPQKDNADAQVQVSIIGDEDVSDKNQKKEIYNKKAVTKAAQPEEKESLQKTTEGSSGAADAEHSARLQDLKTESLPDTKAIKQKEEIHSKRTVPKESWTKEKESLQIDIAESRCHSEFENTTHSVFRSAKFYFHHPVHLPSDQDFCHESLGRSVFMRHSWKDVFQHHPDKQREHTRLPSPHQNVEKPKADYTRIESLSINVNLENEVMHTAKSRARDYPKSDKQINDKKKDHKVTPEPTAQHTVSLNELWNKYQERRRQQKPPEFSDRKELSLVERLDRLAKLLQNPITYSLRTSESTQDDSRGERNVKEWSGRPQQQKNKLQKKKRYKSLEKFHKTAGELKKSKVLSTHQAGKPNQIKIEQIKFDKYILRKQPGFHYKNNTSSDSRPSEESELLTDTPTNIVSTTTSVESDILTQTDREVALHERSSSISTIDTARLIQAFGQERVCLSPRRIKLYSSLTNHQRRYFERRNKKNKKALNTGHPQMTSEHTRRKHIQVANHVISSDSVSSSTSSFCSSSSTLGNKQNVQMLNKSIQAGNLEIVNGVRKHTRDVGMTFPTPSSSEARIEEDSDVTSWSEEKIEEKRLLASYLGDKKLRKNRHSCCEGVSWFVPVENVKSGPKENLPKHPGPGICWFAPITNTKPWREPLREQNRQGQHEDNRGSLASPGRGPLKPFVRATLQESLQFHRPDFISRSGERIKRLKLIVQERKLQNILQSEREALFNTAGEQQGSRDPTRPLLKRGFLDARKNRPVGKKEMIQRSKRIYEQLPEVQRKRDEEKRRLEYKSYRLRAQLFKKKVTNQLLGRKVPWN
ncbi:centrosome-associated protein ALMS1 isoform X2 [Mirounga angustirostris]|uniref:centrosome-associated protein ALMS1 isoform X2 n=1 Tax=Mirounga angustirostris TaxID=9716 RepID=UPI00313B37F5